MSQSASAPVPAREVLPERSTAAEEFPDSARGYAYLNWPIFIAVSAVLLILIALAVWSLYNQQEVYGQAIGDALRNSASRSAVLAYSRAFDAAVVKTSTLFLSYVLMFVGALYVLRSADSRYSLSVEKLKGALETSSPGLVMITLGVVLVGLVLHSQSIISLEEVGTPASPSGASLAEKPQQSSPSGGTLGGESIKKIDAGEPTADLPAKSVTRTVPTRRTALNDRTAAPNTPVNGAPLPDTVVSRVLAAGAPADTERSEVKEVLRKQDQSFLEVLKKLDKLDDIENSLRELKRVTALQNPSPSTPETQTNR